MSKEAEKNVKEVDNPSKAIRLWQANGLYEYFRKKTEVPVDAQNPLGIARRRLISSRRRFSEISEITNKETQHKELQKMLRDNNRAIPQIVRVDYGLLLVTKLNEAVIANTDGPLLGFTDTLEETQMFLKLVDQLGYHTQNSKRVFDFARDVAVVDVLKKLQGESPLLNFSRGAFDGMHPTKKTKAGESFQIATNMEGVKVDYFYPLGDQEPIVSLDVAKL